MGGKKYVDPMFKSFYLSRSVVERAQAKANRLGIRLSAFINDFLDKWASEDDGGDPEAHYERLKREYSTLIEKSKSLTRQLNDLGALGEMRDLAEDLGLDTKNFSNADEIIGKLMNVYDGPEEYVHIFISLLETAKKRREVGRLLTEIRKSKYLSHEGVGVATTLSRAHSFQGAGSLSEMREQTAPENP